MWSGHTPRSKVLLEGFLVNTLGSSRDSSVGKNKKRMCWNGMKRGPSAKIHFFLQNRKHAHVRMASQGTERPSQERGTRLRWLCSESPQKEERKLQAHSAWTQAAGHLSLIGLSFSTQMCRRRPQIYRSPNTKQKVRGNGKGVPCGEQAGAA